MGSLGTCLHLDYNGMGHTAKIPPRIRSTCMQNIMPTLLIIWYWKVMGDAAKISPRILTTCAQNATLSLLITHIITCHEMNVAVDHPSLVPSVASLTTSSYLRN